jgi:hypothetical protein
VLFFSELRTFLTTEKVEAMEVDDAAAGGWRAGKEVTGKSMRINFDISFPATPCGMLSLDAMDASGAASVDVIHNVFKRRLDAAGYPIGEGQKAGDLGAVRSMEELVKEKKKAIAEGRPVARVVDGACGDCYGAGAEGQCCNTCEEVREVYRKKGWQLQMKGVTQCEQEGFYGDVSAQLGAREGCNAYGSLEVPKVPGSFHFGPGPSLQYSYQTINDLVAFAYNSFNVTHRFNAVYCFSMLSFNETTLQKLVDVAEDLRSRMLEDQEFSAYFKDRVIQKIENLVSVKDEVKQLVDELQIKLNGSEVELMKVRSTSKNQQSKGKGST